MQKIKIYIFESKKTKILKNEIQRYKKRIGKYRHLKNKIQRFKKRIGKYRHLKNEIQRFKKRIGKYRQIDIVDVIDSSHKKIGLNQIEKYMQDGLNIVLTERGEDFTTSKFAEYLENTKLDHTRINFFISNAFGFKNEVEEKADLNLSFSKMTLHHRHVLLLLTEQLFRCFDLTSGGKYHKN